MRQKKLRFTFCMCNCRFKSSLMEWINNILDNFNRSLWVTVQDYKFIIYIFLFDFEKNLCSRVIGNFDFTPLQNKSS